MRLARLWALGGVAALLLRSSTALAAKGWNATVAEGLGSLEWVALLIIVGAFVWGEGYRALVKSWAPFVVDRIRGLDGDSGLFRRIAAPLHATGLVGSDRRILIRAWTAVALIVVAVVGVRALPHPWRGMIELGVASALFVGVIGLVVHYVRSGPSPPSSEVAVVRASSTRD